MIAVDVMGGDFAPNAPLEGALGAARKHIPILLCGPRSDIISSLFSLDSQWEKYPIAIKDASQVITMNDNPVRAIKEKPHSSLVQALRSVHEGTAYACVSTGNSGALMVGATFIIGKHENCDRPAIAGFLPGIKDSVFALDLGANTECKPHYFLQFAEQAIEYLKRTTSLSNPRVGLLANGSEATKGSLLTKEAFKLLSTSSLNFVGNIEPYDITTNTVDIVVCDGFSGNIVLKSFEAVSHAYFSTFNNEIEATSLSASPILQTIKECNDKTYSHFNWRKQGGALLLGIKKPVIVAHGASDAYAIENAIQVAWKSSSHYSRNTSYATQSLQ